MRFLPVAVLIGCTSATAPSLPMSEMARQLSCMPDRSVAMERASQAERARIRDRNSSDFPFTRVPPRAVGAVVEVWRDRLAVLMDDESPLPPEGGFMAVYDRAGIKADAYVVRVFGRLAFSQFTLLGSCTTPEIGDRAGEAR